MQSDDMICMLLYMLMAVYMLPVKLGFMGTGAPKTPLNVLVLLPRFADTILLSLYDC